ncbi:hypothetical protein AAFF_G00096690 [Aldrovandia affinis]|uniref:Uncharacterized protein n=1 Tax=Aldrovandia affinis TaxID=143900 RepID=A0AAD7WBX6_9TELE|nr:hypothetical protein AAFF_G00096690 [Aldrovandia affinis]
MAAGGGCGETVDQYRAEVERLTRELAEANREKIRAAECGLVVLEENQTLKQQYSDLEVEQETLKHELEQLQEGLRSKHWLELSVKSGQVDCRVLFTTPQKEIALCQKTLAVPGNGGFGM